MEFYNTATKKVDTANKRVKVMEVVSFLGKERVAAGYSLDKVTEDLMRKLRGLAKYLAFGSVGELVDSALDMKE